VAKGQLVVAVTNPAAIGVSVGVPLGDKEARTHNHTIKGQVTLTSKSISAADGSNQQGACHDTYSVTGTADPAAPDLPFVQLLLCELQKEDSNPVPFGSVVFFGPTVTTCPTDYVPFGDGVGRVLIPGWGSSGTYISADSPLSSGEVRAHSHSWSSRQTFQDVSYEGIRGCCNDNLADDEAFYDVNGSTVIDSTTGSSLLPYIQLLACVSSAGTFDFKQPEGALLFNELGCPPGLNVSIEYAGRFPVGLPDNATAGIFGSPIPLKPGAVETRSHKHSFNSTFVTRNCGIELLTGCCGFGFVANQQYYVADKTDASGVGLPYIEVPLCGILP